MNRSPLFVLKLGSSVLAGEEQIALAVHEIYRYLRRGRRVVAVVSALGYTTDRLLARARRFGDEPAPRGLAALVATGESTAAALLALALDRAGVPATLLDPRQVSFETRGGGGIEGVALLGRGGSDLTALYLAARLGARGCRLVKDVDGLYERDPAARGAAAARRFAAIRWEDALRLGTRVVRHVVRLVACCLPPGDPLAETRNEENRVVITLADGAPVVLAGKGAGRWPTSEAVLAELLDLAELGGAGADHAAAAGEGGR